MKGRFVFTSGVASREFETSGTVEELLFSEFGNRMNFENLGGKVEVYEEAPAQEMVEEAPKPKAKKVKAE